MQVSAYIVLGLLAGCTEPVALPPPPQAVRVAEVRAGPVVQGRRALAEVVTERTVKVIAQVPGTVLALPIGEGVAADGGDVLARIAAPDVAARLERVRAERGRAERERDFACDRTVTDRVLAASGDVSADALATSEKACDASGLAATAASAAEDEAVVASSRSAERAPEAGLVLDHLVDLGQVVGPGTPLVLYGAGATELLLRLPETEIGQGVEPGTTVVFEGGRGLVRAIAGSAKGPGRTVEVRVAVLEGAPALPRIGGTLAAWIVTAEVPNAVAVPVESVGSAAGASFVYVLDGERVERVLVTPLAQQDGWVAVDPPLAPGTRVVVGALDLVDPTLAVFAVETTP